MRHKVITIGRQFGSGGHEIGFKLSEKLQIHLYDKDILDMACDFGGIDRKKIEKLDEKAVNQYFYQTMHNGNSNVIFGVPTSEALFNLQSHEIKRIASLENCIFIGRCADYVLKDEDVSLLRVFIHAPKEFRIRRRMELENWTYDKSKRIVGKMDRRTAKYYHAYTNQIWGNPSNYDIVIDTEKTDIDKAVKLIIERYNNMP
ncbi:MAG: AAA family ATPase [Acutalibacteraceae bacterium]